MNLIEKSLFLKKTALLQKLDFDLLLAISDKLEHITAKKGDTLFLTGDKALGIYFVLEGEIALKGAIEASVSKHKKPQSVKSLKAYSFFGDESLFSDQKRGYSAVAQKETRLFMLAKPHLFALLSECPEVAIELLATYASEVALRSN